MGVNIVTVLGSLTLGICIGALIGLIVLNTANTFDLNQRVFKLERKIKGGLS